MLCAAFASPIVAAAEPRKNVLLLIADDLNSWMPDLCGMDAPGHLR